MGTHKYANGDVYQGEWKAGLPHGKGKYQQASGAIHTGVWINGMKKKNGRTRLSRGKEV